MMCYVDWVFSDFSSFDVYLFDCVLSHPTIILDPKGGESYAQIVLAKSTQFIKQSHIN
jgi:hypothetical protein